MAHRLFFERSPTRWVIVACERHTTIPSFVLRRCVLGIPNYCRCRLGVVEAA